ncbi:RNI-like protein [Mycena sanguinolenta]|uniref:RNI-like protein n=1 Tax=Mycena sanguinolenta TaxID=230812 RepID=A0A8H6YW30_9AGAR|nr:RNI-like protein [Mycena sanguinolenta]
MATAFDPFRRTKPGVKPASVPLSSRVYIDRMDAGLTSVQGAQEIISMISSRRIVTKLILGHNELSDDGCIVLFKFLGSAVGRKYQIAEISLNSNSIGNRGLLAISEYLRGNKCLKELFLQNNRFTAEAATFASFTTALNTSHLELLSLTTNRSLSDSFVEVFLPILDSPHLREVHLSAIGLTPKAAPYLIAYLSSPQCRLHTLKCNGNALGFRAVKSIIRTIERHNFSLSTVELYSNYSVGPASSDNTSEEDDDEGTVDAWKASDAHIRRVLLRNTHLKRETAKEALQLLRYARPLLLSSAGHTASTRCSDCSCVEVPAAVTSAVASEPKHTLFPFRSLPTELQLYIMSFLAPTLSPAQRIRIYDYASSPATLHRAGLCLPGFPGRMTSPGCVLDPASMQFGMPSSGGCSGGKCAGSLNSVVCHKEQQQRTEWLTAVGCAAYDPHREGEVTV